MQHSPGFLKLVQDAKTRIRETNVHEVKQKLDAGESFLLVDVREESEWADRKSTRLNSSHIQKSRMPSSA